MLPIWTLHFPFFFEIMKNENRKSKIRQVLFLFNLLIASADTPIPTEYNIPELQIMFDEILTVVGHNSGQNWKDYHFERKWIVVPRKLHILGLQPREKAAMLGVKTKEYFVEEFTWK